MIRRLMAGGKWLFLSLMLLLLAGCDRTERPTLRMGTEATFPPYEYFSGPDIVGIDVDVVRKIADRLGYDLTVSHMNFDSVITAVQSGKADIAASGITVTEDRKKSADFTLPYVESSQLIIVKDGSPVKEPGPLKGKRVGVQHGTTADLYMVKNFQEPQRYDNGALAIAALLVDKLDAVVLDQDPARVHVSRQPGIRLLDQPLTSEVYAFAFRKGSPLVASFNPILKEMKANGELAKIVAHYQGVMRQQASKAKKSPSSTLFARVKDSFYTNFVKEDRYRYLLNGFGITMLISISAVLVGILIGFLVAVIRTTADQTRKLKFPNLLCKIYLTVIRGTPVVVQLMIIYFVIFSAFDISKVLVAIVAFGVNSGAYVAEIVRAGIQSIDRGQMEAGRSLGLSYSQTMLHIIIPQAFKNVLPALGNEFIVMLKETSVSGFIALQDLTKGGDIIRSQTYDAFLPLLAVAAIYLALVTLFSHLLSRFEKRMKVNE